MINNLKAKLKEKLKKGIELTASELEIVLSKQSAEFDTLILIRANYAGLKKEIAIGSISEENKNIQLAKIRSSLLYIINQINEDNIELPLIQNSIPDSFENKFDLEEEFILKDYTWKFNSEIELFKEFEKLLIEIRENIEFSSKSFKTGTIQINRMLRTKKVNIRRSKSIDLKVSKDLRTYTNKLDNQLESYENLSHEFIVIFLNFLQLSENEIRIFTIKTFSETLECIKDIGKTNKSMRNNLNALNLNLNGIDSSISMKKSTTKAIEVNLKFIEILREFYFYLDKIEEDMELELLKMKK